MEEPGEFCEDHSPALRGGWGRQAQSCPLAFGYPSPAPADGFGGSTDTLGCEDTEQLQISEVGVSCIHLALQDIPNGVTTKLPGISDCTLDALSMAGVISACKHFMVPDLKSKPHSFAKRGTAGFTSTKNKGNVSNNRGWAPGKC